MNGLPDTQLLVWTAFESDRLSRTARQHLTEPGSTFYFSAASIWELAIKFALKKPGFNVNPESLRRQLIKAGFLELPVTSQHAAAVLNLPKLHDDPFDRLLLAQAIEEGLTLLTADRILAKYPANVLRV